MYRVSVIMPIYNNEVTLKLAIDSILEQSVFDFELLLINDGSTDSSVQICMEYERREPLLVEVIHQEHQGFANARNIGLSQARGSYIYFADARNILAPRMLESNLKLAEEHDAELVAFGFSQRNESSRKTTQHIPELPFLLSQKRFRKHFRNFYCFYPYELCNKLYEVRYLREKKIKFYDMSLKEKHFFNLDVYRDLSKVVFNRKDFNQKNCSSRYDVTKYQKELLDIHIDLVNHLKNIFIYWGETKQYQDLIIREYYKLLEAEVLNLTSPSLNLSKKELEKKIVSLLSDDRISEVLKNENELSTKKPYEIVLWNSFRKRNTRVIVKLIKRKIKAKKISENIKEKFGRWFN